MMAIYNHNGAWTQLVQQSHAFCPSSIDNPWGLILYCDEIIPGNVLGGGRKKGMDHILQLPPVWATLVQ